MEFATIESLIAQRSWKPGLGISAWDSAANYAGADLSGWVVGFSQTRDSDCLARANFEASLADLGGEDEAAGVRVVSIGHWACGWVEQIHVRTDATAKLELLRAQLNKVADYPVLDDGVYSEVESEEREETYRNCRSQFAAALCEFFGWDTSVDLDRRFGARNVDAVLVRLFDEDCSYRGTEDGFVRVEDIAMHVAHARYEFEALAAAKYGGRPNRLAARLLAAVPNQRKGA